MMKKKYYTLMVVPSATSKIKKVKVSGKIFRSLMILAVICLSFSGYFVYDYLTVKGEVIELEGLRTETRAQRLKINSFAQQIIDVEKEMARLRKFDAKLRVAFDLDRNFYSPEKMMGMGGAGDLELSEYPEILEGRIDQLTAQIEKDIVRLREEASTQEESLNQLVEFLQEQRSLLVSTPSIWPVKGWVTSGFQRRTDPFTGRWEKHKGLDVATNEGTPIIAPSDGVVTYVGRKLGFGKILSIDHGYGYTTRYGHNSRIVVKQGQRVSRGQVISFVGNTGKSTGPHLHYEIHKNGIPINPADYILN